MIKYVVYCHTNKINGKRYVGITSLSLQRRWKNGDGYKANKHFYSAIKKYGWEEFSHEVLYDGLTKEQACEKEKYLIAKWDLCDTSKGYNNTLGGEHGLMSEQTKKRMSEAQKGEKGYWYGKKLPEIAKQKMSEVKKGKVPKSTPPRRVYCKDTDTLYPSMCEAGRQLGISISLVYKLCNGQNKREPKLHLNYEGEQL